MEETFVLLKEDHDDCDPHNYFNSGQKRGAHFISPTKRCFLNECIRQIYIESNRIENIFNIFHPLPFNKYEMLRKLDDVFKPVVLSPERLSLDRVKRQLFRAPKYTARKSIKPQKNNLQLSQIQYFKPLRSNLRVKKIRRTYLSEGRRIVEHWINMELQQEFLRSTQHQPLAVNINDNLGLVPLTPVTFPKICGYYIPMTRPHPYRKCSSTNDQNKDAVRFNRRAEQYREDMRTKCTENTPYSCFLT